MIEEFNRESVAANVEPILDNNKILLNELKHAMEENEDCCDQNKKSRSFY